jgi:hypothetical protein
MNIPARIIAGDTLAWTEVAASHPAPTFTLKCALHRYGINPIILTAVGSGTSHAFSASASATALYAVGEYDYAIYAESGAGEALARTTLATGKLWVNAGIGSATNTTETRLPAEVKLAEIDAAILRLSSREVESMSVNGRTVTYRDIGSLVKAKALLLQEVARERAAARIALGLDSGRRILTRFGA